MKVVKLSPLKGNNIGDVMISKSIEFLLGRHGVEVESLDLLLRPTYDQHPEASGVTQRSWKVSASTFLQLRLPWFFYLVKKVIFKRSGQIGKFLELTQDADVIVFGGGNILMNKFGSDYAYRVSEFADVTPKRSMVYSAGAGPFHFEARRLVERITKRVGFISVRDGHSASFFDAQDHTEFHNFIDPVFVVSDLSPMVAGKQNLLGINLIDGYLSTAEETRLASQIAEVCIALDMHIRFVTTAYPNDRLAVDRMANLVGGLSPDIEIETVELSCEVGSVGAAYSGLEYFLGTRMHSQIFALAYGIPTIGIPWDEKVRAMLKEFFGASYDEAMIYSPLSSLRFDIYDEIDVPQFAKENKERVYREAKQVADFLYSGT